MWGSETRFCLGVSCFLHVLAASQACEQWGYTLSPKTLCAARQGLPLPLFRRCRNRLRETERQSQDLFFTLFLEVGVHTGKRIILGVQRDRFACTRVALNPHPGPDLEPSRHPRGSSLAPLSVIATRLPTATHLA